MIGAAGGGPGTAGADPLIAVVADAVADGLTLLKITGRTTDGNLVVNADDVATMLANGVVAAVRAHQNTTGQHTAARALRDAADFTAEFWGEPVGVHIADWLRNRADTLDPS